MEAASRGRNVTDQVYDRLREAILSAELQPDSLHSVLEFAEELGVSRTPVREAALRLADAGMVTIERNRGIRISSSNVTDVRWVFEFRLLLEVPAARAAASLPDGEVLENLEKHLAGMMAIGDRGGDHAMHVHHRAFHEAIAETFANDRIGSLLNLLRDGIRARSHAIPKGRGNHAIAEEHRPILEGIKAADCSGAGRAMAFHLVSSGTLLMEQVGKVTGEEVPYGWERRFVEAVGVDLGR